jgi:hypothetical protein
MDANTSNNLWILVSTAVGTLLGSCTTFFFPKIWEVYKSRYIDPKTELFQTLQSEINWYRDRADRLVGLHVALGSESLPDVYMREIYISKLDPKDREWATKITNIPVLRQAAQDKASECRQNADEAARMVDLIGDKTFFPL